MSTHSTTFPSAPVLCEEAHNRETGVFEIAHAPLVAALPLLDFELRRRALPAALAPAGSYLAFEAECERLLVRLAAGITHIGRGLASTVRLGEHRVSRHHAIITLTDARARLLDDRSSTGTFLNGRRIEDAELRDGDIIRLGPVILGYVQIPAAHPRGARTDSRFVRGTT